MLFQSLWLLVGLGLLLVAGDILVRGAVSAALRMGVSPLVAGIVVIGFGTSLPEILVSVDAALANAEDLAHGNIVGSNIANMMLVLAATALFAPIHTNLNGITRAMSATVLATIAWIGLTFYVGLNPVIGAAFLLAISGYVWFTIASNRTASAGEVEIDPEVEEVAKQHMPAWKFIAFILIGLIGLALGARLTINAGVAIARELNVSEAVIGLTLLAVGTSLPEIGASVAAAIRKHADVVIGNVIGSNLFNILAAGGAVALIKTQTLSNDFHGYSHLVMAAATALVAIFVFNRWNVGRVTGIVLLVGYLLYVIGLVNGANISDLLQDDSTGRVI